MQTLSATEPADRTYSLGDGFRAALPVALLVGVFGASFGVLARSTGFPLLAPIVMSLTTFGGSAQFAAASVFADGGGVLAAATAAILVNAHYGTIGLAVAPMLRGGILSRFVQGNLIVDEAWGIAHVRGGVDRNLLIGGGLAVYVCWFGGTVIGTLGGSVIGDPNDFGLDAAFPALFLALIVPRLRQRDAFLAAVLGGGIALALIPFARPGVPIIAASLGCLAGWKRR